MKTRSYVVSCASALALSLLPSLAMAKPEGHNNPPISIQSGDWNFSFGGYARTGFMLKSFDGDRPDGATDHLGGFVNLNGRMNFGLKFKDLISARISMDGTGGVNALNGDADGKMALKDAYLDFDIVPAFRIRTGQFKPPIDFENITSTADSDFIQDSVVSVGGSSSLYNKTEYNAGISPGREIGISIYSEMLDFNNVGINYNIALTNGKSAFSKSSEEGFIAAYARLELALMNALYGESKPGHFFSIAASASWESRQLKIDANDDDDFTGNRFTVSGELHAKYKDFKATFEGVWQRYDVLKLDETAFDPSGAYTGKKSTDALDKFGIVAQITYILPIEYFRFQLGYRFAMMRPIVDGAKERNSEDLYQHTASIGYYVENYPILVRIDYTNNAEESQKIHNDTLFGMVQVKW